MKRILILLACYCIASLEACLDKSTTIEVRNPDFPLRFNLGNSLTDPTPQDYETECYCVTNTRPNTSPVPATYVPPITANCVPYSANVPQPANCVPCQCCTSNYVPTSQLPTYVPSSATQLSGLSNLVPTLYPENIFCSMDSLLPGILNSRNIGTLDSDLAMFVSQNNYASRNNQYGNVYSTFC